MQITVIRAASAAPTEFHNIVLYDQGMLMRLMIVNKISKKPVYTKDFDPKEKWKSEDTGEQIGPATGTMRRIAHDPKSNSAYLYSETTVVKLEIINEDISVWRNYLAVSEFDLAQEYCKDARQREIVTVAHADHSFENANYDEAAVYYARTNCSFEQVALMFLNKGERNALHKYLVEKIRVLPRSEHTQLTVCTTWVVEIFLKKLSLIKDQSDKSQAQYKQIINSFQAFVKANMEYLNRAATYNLITHHGRIDMLIWYADLNQDYEMVITFHIQRREWELAQQVINKQPDNLFFYKYSPKLIRHIPVMVVSSWIERQRLEPQMLIPSLMQYNIKNNEGGEKADQAVRYLKEAVEITDDPAIWNYLLSTYAHAEGLEDELINFINDVPNGSDRVDWRYAQRICLENNKLLACVHVYTIMGLHGEAVALALRAGDLELAQKHADKPEDDDKLRKKLWLTIARHVIEKEKDVAKAIDLLDLNDLLKIEDILTFFPETVQIKTFKDQICQSLALYNQDIEDLKNGMDEATHSAEKIRMQAEELKNRNGLVKATDKCELCSDLAISRRFYYFHCKHMFHQDCLVKEVRMHLSDDSRHEALSDRQKASDLEQRIKQEEKRTRGRESREVEKLKKDLDDLVASECPFCGDVMMQMVTQKFVPKDVDQRELQSWQI